MGRLLRGTVKQTKSGTWRAELPVARGAKGRITKTFDTLEAAETWRSQGLTRLLAAESNLMELGSSVIKHREAPAPMTVEELDPEKLDQSLIEQVADEWLNYYFVELNSAEYSRHLNAKENLVQFLGYCRAMNWSSGSDVTRKGMMQYLAWLSNTGLPTPGMQKPVGKRCFKNGKGYAPRVIRMKINDIKQMLIFGEDEGIWKLNLGVTQLKAPKIKRNTQAESRFAVTWKETALIAEHLHPIHQMTLWLLRVLGLRVSECFGILLSDIRYEKKTMLIDIRRQGGGGQQERDEVTKKYVRVERVNRTKTVSGYRTLVIPKQLQALIEAFIEIFHPNFGNAECMNHPLIPGLTNEEEPRKMTFYNALKIASGKIKLNLAHLKEFQLEIGTHDFRRSVNTDLIFLKYEKTQRSVWLGQRSGSSDNETSYVMRDRELRVERMIAKSLERLIAKQLPKGLVIPTCMPIGTQNRRAFASSAKAVDKQLQNCGWLKSC